MISRANYVAKPLALLQAVQHPCPLFRLYWVIHHVKLAKPPDPHMLLLAPHEHQKPTPQKIFSLQSATALPPADLDEPYHHATFPRDDWSWNITRNYHRFPWGRNFTRVPLKIWYACTMQSPTVARLMLIYYTRSDRRNIDKRLGKVS